jgi:hypothetical protein
VSADPVFSPASCRTCGGELVLAPCPSEDAFQWVGDDGSTRCPARAYPPEIMDSAWWIDLQAKAKAGAVEPPPEPWWADVEGGMTDDVAARYSVISAALNLNWHPWGKGHDREGGLCTNPGIRWCHEEPMRWAPSGWVCRVPSQHRSIPVDTPTKKA